MALGDTIRQQSLARQAVRSGAFQLAPYEGAGFVSLETLCVEVYGAAGLGLPPIAPIEVAGVHQTTVISSRSIVLRCVGADALGSAAALLALLAPDRAGVSDVTTPAVLRYVGAVRPFVPAIAGMAGMPVRRYAFASGLACLSWGVLFLAPGWVLGRAYDAVAAVAGHLVIVIGLLVAVLALAWAWVLYTYRWFADHADSLLARALDWSHRHPVVGRHSAALFDPGHRESTSLALLAVLLLAIGWAWFALLVAVVGHGEPLGLDLAVHQAMLALRNPLADYPMAALASLGDWPVLAPACAAVLIAYPDET